MASSSVLICHFILSEFHIILLHLLVVSRVMDSIKWSRPSWKMVHQKLCVIAERKHCISVFLVRSVVGNRRSGRTVVVYWPQTVQYRLTDSRRYAVVFLPFLTLFEFMSSAWIWKLFVTNFCFWHGALSLIFRLHFYICAWLPGGTICLTLHRAPFISGQVIASFSVPSHEREIVGHIKSGSWPSMPWRSRIK